MKFAQRILCLTLAAVLCLGLAACASKEDKAFAEAEAMLAAGDYEAAIAAFQAIGRYQEISNKIAEAEFLLDQQNAGFLFGTWKDLASGSSFTFAEGGALTLTSSQETISMAYDYTSGTVQILEPLIFPLSVEEIDGVTHLISEGYGYDLVPEANYEALAPITVEITMDNWEEYFELRQADTMYTNNFGEVTDRFPGYGIFLKEEYVSRLTGNYDCAQADFEIVYDEAWCIVHGDLLSGDYTLEKNKPYWMTEETGLTRTSELSDWSLWPDLPEDSPYFGTIAAEFFAGSYMEDGNKFYMSTMENVQVSRVQGSLTLMP